MLFVRVSPKDTVGVIGLIMLFERVPPEDTVGVIGSIMLFVRPTTRGHGGRYRVNDAIRTCPTRGHGVYTNK